MLVDGVVAESVAAPAPIELEPEPDADSSSIFCWFDPEPIEEPEPVLLCPDPIEESEPIDDLPEPIDDPEPDGDELDDELEPDCANAVMLTSAAATVNTKNFFIWTSMFNHFSLIPFLETSRKKEN